MNEISDVTSTLPLDSTDRSAVVAKTLSKNIIFSLARVAVSSLVALLLPAYLTHRLPVATYGAWILILQLAAFVSFLDLGVQTGVAKFVAEHDARGDEAAASHYASAGLAIMICMGLLGAVLTIILAWQVPQLFHDMPSALYRDVRISLMLVGTSLSFGLVCSIFSAVFLGLQCYAVPMTIAILNRSCFAVAILMTVSLHGSLVAMGAAIAAVNVTTALLQIVAWQKMASRIRLSPDRVNSAVLRQMTSYCSLLAVWTVGMLCVSGLDVTIVGHYAYDQTAFYSVATLPINFMMLMIAAMLGPMMPASSALSTHRSVTEMGDILARTTRYSTMLLLLTGLPLIVYGFPLLSLWVGPVYAAQSLKYLRILVVANVLRNLFAPYATMVVATGRLKAATAAPVFEAFVNLGSSIYFARHFGAIGVAYGTMLGAVTSVSLHFAVSMHFTRSTLAVTRSFLFLTGLLRPAMLSLPSLLFLFIRPSSLGASLGTPVMIAWGVTTLLIAGFACLSQIERRKLKEFLKGKASTLTFSSN